MDILGNVQLGSGVLIQISNSDTSDASFRTVPLLSFLCAIPFSGVLPRMTSNVLSVPFRFTVIATFEPGAVSATRNFNWLAS